MIDESCGAWLRRFLPRPDAGLRLICVPHGGGGAGAFLGWAELLPSAVELLAVQYPGRGDRLADPVPRAMAELVTELTDAIAAVADRPYALFGHSMGATVAYEVAQEARRRGLPGPVHLVASAREAPHDEKGGDVHRGGDDDLYAELLRLGGTAPDVLADPGLRAMIFACARGDYRLIETYRPLPLPPLDCPVTVFLGDRDPDLTPDEAGRWRHATWARTRLEVFPGDHFYLVPRRHAVLASLRRLLAPYGRGAG
ncbi:Thioesterase domain-containing protein [Actinomadura madurae]|uniref:Thioesterase domain-containing protein n=1 Tax=Actinomadura madurae TaxID=1993 RepID=A0A1I5SG50_9ACTN|nr:alpha/beta fold hydrolase [Actinomadura madurae]SFP69316.1 Thioesterase domain-containing protein [Actinomadura madurae]